MKLSKYQPLNAITDIWQPKYSDGHVIIAEHKIKRSKLDIKLRFSNVNDTSGYSGDWFLARSKALRYKKYINNGLVCRSIPFGAFEKIEIMEKDYHEI